MDHVQQTNEVIVRAVMDIETGVWELVEREPYLGPWALADRAAQNAAKQAGKQAGAAADVASENAATTRSQLTPFYRSEMTAQHGFSPEQTNELLNFAGAGAGGAGATSAGQIESEAARTRNTAGFTPALQQAARDRSRQMAESNLAVGAQDVMGAKQLNQEGAAGMQNLYGTDTKTMLDAMGVRNQDVNAQIEAGKSGWFQNLMGGVGALTGLANAGAGLRNSFKG